MTNGFKVVLTKANYTTVYGTYATMEQAEEQAKPHRAKGYWTSVVVEKV